MYRVEAQPYNFPFDPKSAALVIIDMQRDFLEPGGFGAALGNDVACCGRPSRPPERVLRACREAGHDGRAHPRGPSARPVRSGASEAGARQFRDRHRRSRADGPHPGARRGGPRHHSGTGAGTGRTGGGQAGQGRVLRHRPGGHAARPRHRAAHRLRRHHRGLRQHDGARGKRSRLRLPGAGGLHRLLLPRIPASRDRDDQGAGRHLRLGRPSTALLAALA